MFYTDEMSKIPKTRMEVDHPVPTSGVTGLPTSPHEGAIAHMKMEDGSGRSMIYMGGKWQDTSKLSGIHSISVRYDTAPITTFGGADSTITISGRPEVVINRHMTIDQYKEFAGTYPIPISVDEVSVPKTPFFWEVKAITDWIRASSKESQQREVNNLHRYIYEGRARPFSWFHLVDDPKDKPIVDWILQNGKCALCHEDFWVGAIAFVSVPSLAVHAQCLKDSIPLYGEKLQLQLQKILEARK